MCFAFAAVADGHGGDKCSSYLAGHLLRDIYESSPDEFQRAAVAQHEMLAAEKRGDMKTVLDAEARMVHALEQALLAGFARVRGTGKWHCMGREMARGSCGHP